MKKIFLKGCQDDIKIFSIFMLAISLIFYLFFAVYDGVVFLPDSFSYIDMLSYREPIYPMFLGILRSFLPGYNSNSDAYLLAVIFVQSIFAALSTWSLTAYLMKELELQKIFSILILLTLFMPSFVWRVIIWNNSIYSNSIMSEGVSISCWLLFFRFLFEYVNHQTTKSFSLCCVLSFVLISIRKQLFISLILLIICVLAVFFRKNQYRRGIVNAFICFICILGGSMVFDLGYNYAVRGEVVRHSGDTRFITTMAFYTADRGDSRYIEDDNVREIFLKVYDSCDEKGLLKSSAGDGWVNRISHLIDSYDGIHRNFLELFGVFADNFALGFVMTVSHRRYSILRWYSLIVYLCYVSLLIYSIWRKEDKKVCLFAILTLISMIVNVAFVSLVIFSQTRYMIYNTALFYISFLLMTKSFLKKFKQK